MVALDTPKAWAYIGVVFDPPDPEEEEEWEEEETCSMSRQLLLLQSTRSGIARRHHDPFRDGRLDSRFTSRRGDSRDPVAMPLF
jgi:hypothetical protein